MHDKLPDGNGKLKILPVHILAVFLLIAFLGPMAGRILTNRPVTLSYSEFKSGVRGNAVQSVVIGSERIDGTLTDGNAFTTLRVEDPGLLSELEANAVDVNGRASGSRLGWILPFALMGGLSFWLFRRLRKGMGSMGGSLFSFGKSKARVTQGEKSGVTFEDIGGAGEAVTDLREITEFLRSPERFQRLGGKMPKGILLVGPPGTGKTLLARATAGEADVPFFSLSGAEFVEMFVGVGASRVRDLFEQAKKRAPSIVFIDEIDAIGGRRSAAAGLSMNDEREQTLNQLLAEMDGFQPTSGLMLIAATNRPDVLDPALLRPGRFDRRVLVGLPDLGGRLEILQIHAKGIVLGPDVELANLARITPGFSGADIANVINEAALLASRAGKEAVDAGDFDEAIERVIAGSERRTRAMNEREKRVVAVHESGHALVAGLLPNVDPVHKVTIIPRGNALGYTWQRPVEDRYLMGQAELLDRLAVLLGGRAAEQLVFSEASTGAADDLARATDLARRMVTEYGMSDEVGPVRLTAEPKANYLGNAGGLDASVSPQTAARVDAEVERIVREALRQAEGLLNCHKAALDGLSHELCEKETLSGVELLAILSAHASGSRRPPGSNGRQAKARLP